MAIDDVQKMTPLAAYGRDQKRQDRGQAKGEFSSNNQGQGHDGDDQAVQADLQIPPEELTPSVRAVLQKMSAEIESLRQQLEAARHYDHEIVAQLDQRQDLPSLTHHALTREVKKIINHVARTQLKSSFAYIRVTNLEKIRQQFGLQAGYQVMEQLATLLNQRLRATDHLGSLGGNGFGVIFALSDHNEAHRLCGELCHFVSEQSFHVAEGITRIDVQRGVFEIQGDESLDTVMNGAYRDLLSHV